MTLSIEEVSRIIREVAAEEIVPRFRQLAEADVREKTGPQDLVTTADLEAEKALSRRLAPLAPSAAVVGEEAAEHDPTLLERLADGGEAWVIDPVDGTYNFSQGDDGFGVIVAYVRDGAVAAGWIYAPMQDALAVAELGGGAWQEDAAGRRRRLRVAEATSLDKMTGALYAGRRRAPDLYERIQRIRHRLAGRSYRRCVAFEYLALARGAHHFALFTRQLPWDHAAGALLHREAGGYNARLDGEPYSPTVHQGTLLLAPDRGSWERLHELLTSPEPVERLLARDHS
ncbi:MAG: inositol monophosphatase family protein [Alphaproteobacteria bacterium]|nr:inositol monophosphatase family protein [Alphaproteobacteria bacterium]